ncbi:MAG TPA: molybdenum cofactor guanylyltransferase [Clostridiales bacterium]|nr:molybdenum cofactor guanylyltransferase [Clostridiales bacterium]
MTERKKEISCAILAGGKASRMNGENKALLKVGEMNNLDKILSFSEDYFKEIFIIANDSSKFKGYDIAIYSDIFRNVGPLGGIHSALLHSRTDNVFFLPCDMPFISESIVKKEIEFYFKTECEIIIPRMGCLIEPMHSIFSIKVLSDLEKHIRGTDNYSIRSFFDKADVYYWDIEDNEDNKMAFFNINTHHDLSDAHNKVNSVR